MAKRARGKSRVVLAPEPEVMAGQLAPNRVLSVRLKPGEDVQWLWTALPQGGRYVSGYQILEGNRSIERLFERGEIKALPLEKVLAKYGLSK